MKFRDLANSFDCAPAQIRTPSAKRQRFTTRPYKYKPHFGLQSHPQSQLSTMTSSSAGTSLDWKGKIGKISISSPFDLRKQGSVRLSDLKKTIWKDSMAQSWIQVLDALKEKAKQIESVGSKASISTKHPLFSH